MKRHILLGSFALLLATACAHNPPPELVEAREAYERAAEGPTKEYDPAALHVAKNALLAAERAYRNKEDSWLVRSQAYIAMRKSELAETSARTQMHERSLADASKREEQLEDEIIEQTKDKLADVEQELDKQKGNEAQTAAQLEAERQRRQEAERKAAAAMAELQRAGSVKQDPRGTIIVLSGNILFSSGHYELLPGAKANLDQVADALLAGDPDAVFVVEGHTDSQGSAENNMALSQNRANAVRDYLVGRGIPPDRITAEGYGEDRPIADNASRVGRANNRRVEIVIKPATA